MWSISNSPKVASVRISVKLATGSGVAKKTWQVVKKVVHVKTRLECNLVVVFTSSVKKAWNSLWKCLVSTEGALLNQMRGSFYTCSCFAFSTWPSFHDLPNLHELLHMKVLVVFTEISWASIYFHEAENLRFTKTYDPYWLFQKKIHLDNFEKTHWNRQLWDSFRNHVLGLAWGSSVLLSEAGPERVYAKHVQLLSNQPAGQTSPSRIQSRSSVSNRIFSCFLSLKTCFSWILYLE